MQTNSLYRTARASLSCAAALCVTWTAHAADLIEFSIPPQPLETALLAFADQTGAQVATSSTGIATLETKGVSGRMTPHAALARLIEGNDLEIRLTGDRSFSLLARSAPTSSAPAGAESKSRESPQRNTAPTGEPESQKREPPANAAGELTGRRNTTSALEEVVVTAQKREERLQDVPISIAVISNQDIARRGLIGMEDYLRSIPSVNVVDVGTSDNAIVVRGITTSPQNENASSGATVATYFGETPITGLGGYAVGGIDVRPVDLERIELLRGPQGTTFGSASLSGALRLIPKAPELDRFGANVTAAYSQTSGRGDDNNNMLQAVMNFPIAQDRFGVRLVGYRYDESGSYRNSVGADPASLAIANQWGVGSLVSGFIADDIGSQLSTGGRLSALWRLTDNLRLTLNVLTQTVEQQGTPVSNLGQYGQANFPVAPVRRVDGYPGEYAKSNLDLYNIVLDYDLPWARWTTTASWTDSGISPLLVTVGRPFPLTSANYYDVESFTSETRLSSHLDGRFQFTAGVFYEDMHSPNVVYTDWLGLGVAPNPLPSLGLPATDPLAIVHTTRDVTQRALFGELSYALTDQITATIGGRYFDYDRQEERLQEGGLVRVPFGTGVPTRLRRDENDHTLKANVSYKPVDDTLIYASWSQGFRLGRPAPGVNPGVCDVNNDGLIDSTNVTIESTRNIDSDFLDSSEIGAKFALFDRRMTIDVAAYHQKWNELPILVLLPRVGLCIGSYTANAGTAQSNGAEIQASFVVIDGLKLTLGGSYTEAELTKDAPALFATKGARLPGAPRVSANLGAQYDFQIAGNRTFVRADSYYTGEFYGDLLETPGLKAGEYIKVDARAGIAFGSLSAEVFVKNLTNQDDFTWRGISGGTNPYFGYQLRPRTIGVQLGYSFQ